MGDLLDLTSSLKNVLKGSAAISAVVIVRVDDHLLLPCTLTTRECHGVSIEVLKYKQVKNPSVQDLLHFRLVPLAFFIAFLKLQGK